MLGTVVKFLGYILLLKLIFDILAALWSLVRPSKVRSFGKWAVVTGATDGIGLAFCHEFAANGLNVVLISRTQSKLDASAQEIKKANPNVEVMTVQADFDSSDDRVYKKIKEALCDVPIGILVNNVGRSYPHAEYLHLLSDELVESMIRMNITSTTRMTRMVLDGMVERKKGAIVNIGSAAGLLPCGSPLYAVYSGTKAYVDFFSRSLDVAYASKGITVQCQAPYFVTSKLSKIRKTSLTVPSPEAYVKHAVRQIGYGASVVPFPAHAITNFVIQQVLPRFLVAKGIFSMHVGIRKKAYKKMASSKKD